MIEGGDVKCNTKSLKKKWKNESLCINYKCFAYEELKSYRVETNCMTDKYDAFCKSFKRITCLIFFVVG
jgi:hypothetical protein